MRETRVKCRRPGGTEWESLSLEQATDMIAERIIRTRADTWEAETDDGKPLKRTLGIHFLGGATLCEPMPASRQRNMRGAFALREHSERDGTVRLELSGELDLAVAGRLESRLRELAEDRYRVQLDLSRLEFMDSSGIQAVIAALNNSRSDGWQLTINPQLTDRVRRVIEITGITEHLWPDRD